MTHPTKWEKVLEMIGRYYIKMNSVSNLLKAEDPILRMNKDKERLDFHIDKEALKRIDKIRNLPKFDRLVVFFGTDEDRGDCNTFIILGVDAIGNILEEHKKDNPSGEETWPDGQFNLRTDPDDLEKFLK